MTDRIVVNTGPILALSKMQAFDLIGRLPFEFVSPSDVEREILIGNQKGYDIEMPAWVRITELRSKISPLGIASLDLGEASVIQLALESNIDLVCIDELKGRRAAFAVGLRVTGSLGLLGRAKKLGLIDDVRPFIQRAMSAGIFYDQNLIETFLRSLGE